MNARLPLTALIAALAFTPQSPASADTLSAKAAAESLFNGVWAPEHRMPGGPGGPGGGRPDGPPPRGAGFGPPPGGPGFGPPPGGPGIGPPPGGPGGRDRIAISAEDQAKGLEQGDIHTRSIMTAEGKAKFATFDPLDHPTSNCRTPGLPSIAQIPELQEWKVDPAALTIRHESDDVRRAIHFDVATHPTEEHSVLGHAFGSLAGDTLTIETGNLSAEWGGLGRSAPGSDARVIRETYRLVDKDTISGVIEIEDRKFLTQTLRMPVTLKRQPAGTQIVSFPCDVEVAQRDYAYIKAGVEKNDQ